MFGKTAIEDLQDIPRLQVDIPETRPWGTDATVLRDSIAANDGMAMIGLKAPGSERMRANNGIREALTARQFEAALQVLADRNIEIKHVFLTFGAASVQMDPDEVYELFDHPMVDYIEIPMVFTLASSLLNNAPALFEMSAQQTTPWGITMVRAPEAGQLLQDPEHGCR